MASSFPSTPSQLYNALHISAQHIHKCLPKAEVSIIIGSSFAYFSNILEDCVMLDYCDIPFLQITTVAEHTGILFHGKINGCPIYCWGGRLHAMEGFSNDQITYITHLSAFLGCHTLITTNSSGTTNPDVNIGDIMLITDFINNSGTNPLDTRLHWTFTDLHTNLNMNKDFTQWIIEMAKKAGIKCVEGVYCWVKGPNFEMPFGIECFSKLGADIFGMSAVPEIAAGLAHGMRVIPIAIITNKNEVLEEDSAMDGISMALGEIRDFFKFMIKELPKFEGNVNLEWINDIEPVLFQKPKEVVDKEHILECIKWIRVLINDENKPKIAVAINSKNSPNFKSFKYVFYNELPYFPQNSLASRYGKLIIGELGNKNIICLLNCDFEGLEIYESYFIIQLLIGLDVNFLHYAIPVVNEGHTLTGIKDYFCMKLQNATIAPTIDAVNITGIGEQLLLAFPGPTLPTEAEMNLAHLLGHNLVTISNMSILNEASNRGLPHSASCYSSNFSAETFNSYNLSQIIDPITESSIIIPLKFPIASLLTDTNLIEPPLTQDDIEALASEIKIGLYPHLTVIVSEEIGNLLLRHFKIRISYSFRSIITQTLHFTSDGIMIIKGSPLLKDQDNIFQSFSPVFLSNQIGIESLIIIEEVSTCNSEISLGTIVKITDQCGLSCFNPLIGLNISSWGERFPYISDAFDDEIQYKKIFEEHRIKTCETKLLFTSKERGLSGISIAKVASTLGAGVIGNTGPYSVIISQHKLSHQPKRKLLYLGYVNHDPIANITINAPPIEYQLAMKQIILKELKTII